MKTLYWDRAHNTVIDPAVMIYNDDYFKRNKVCEVAIPENTTDWCYVPGNKLYLVVNGRIKTMQLQVKRSNA